MAQVRKTRMPPTKKTDPNILIDFRKSSGGTTIWGRKKELSHLVAGYFAISRRKGLNTE
jgi:hypothetical protein